MSLPSGRSTSMFFRLWTRTPRRWMSVMASRSQLFQDRLLVRLEVLGAETEENGAGYHGWYRNRQPPKQSHLLGRRRVVLARQIRNRPHGPGRGNVAEQMDDENVQGESRRTHI